MITIAAALKNELSPLISRFKIVAKESFSGLTVYKTEGEVQFLRYGIGSDCRERFARYIDRYNPRLIVTIGTAGILEPQIKIFEIYGIEKIIDSLTGKELRIKSFDSINNLTLLTVDKAVADKQLRDSYLSKFAASLVDMETWYCANEALSNDIEFMAFKIASDYADNNTENDFYENLYTTGQKMANFFYNVIIKRLSDDE